MSADTRIVDGAVETAGAIISGLIKGKGYVTQEEVDGVIHAVAIMRTPKILGIIPLIRTGILEHKISENLQDQS